MFGKILEDRNASLYTAHQVSGDDLPPDMEEGQGTSQLLGFLTRCLPGGAQREQEELALALTLPELPALFTREYAARRETRLATWRALLDAPRGVHAQLQRAGAVETLVVVGALPHTRCFPDARERMAESFVAHNASMALRVEGLEAGRAPQLVDVVEGYVEGKVAARPHVATGGVRQKGPLRVDALLRQARRLGAARGDGGGIRLIRRPPRTQVLDRRVQPDARPSLAEDGLVQNSGGRRLARSRRARQQTRPRELRRRSLGLQRGFEGRVVVPPSLRESRRRSRLVRISGEDARVVPRQIPPRVARVDHP